MNLFRNLLFWIALALVGALVAQVLVQDPGEVLVRFRGHDYRTTVVGAALLLVDRHVRAVAAVDGARVAVPRLARLPQSAGTPAFDRRPGRVAARPLGARGEATRTRGRAR